MTEVFEDDDDVFITVDHKSAKNSEPDFSADEYAKSTKIKYVYRPYVWVFNTICLRLLNETHKCTANQAKLWLFRQGLRVSDGLLFSFFQTKVLWFYLSPDDDEKFQTQNEISRRGFPHYIIRRYLLFRHQQAIANNNRFDFFLNYSTSGGKVTLI